MHIQPHTHCSLYSQGTQEIEVELLCFVGTLAHKHWLHITSGIASPVCHQPNTERAEWNTDGTGVTDTHTHIFCLLTVGVN